ncbi:hypothetical protein KAX97_12480 [candidate division WOR-3 bacterium]|nr:hypothetical protein [candidate division WOR-3 bacterium]
MTDILIRAARNKVEHKFKDQVDPDTDYCYWTGIHPRRIIEKVMFTDGVTVYAEGVVMDADEDEGLCFLPLRRVNYPQPKKAPTRGFTYVTQDEQK